MMTSTGKRMRLKNWWVATRPHSLGATISPCLVVAALAFRQGSGDWILWLAILTAVLLVQIGANFTDEFSDHSTTVDKYPAPHKVIARGLLTAVEVRRGALVVFSVATTLGIWILSQAGWSLLPLCLAAVAIAWFYSAGNYPWGDWALGEILVFLALGPGLIAGGVRVLTGVWSSEAVWYSLPLGALVSAILLLNNLRDEAEDRHQGRRTLVTQLGHRGGVILLIGIFLIVMAWPLLNMVLHSTEVGRFWTMLVWLSTPLLWRAWRVVHLSAEDARSCLHEGLRITAAAHLCYGFLLALALLLEAQLPLASN